MRDETSDPLHDLLRAADAAPPHQCHDLAQRVLRRHRNRRIVRTGGALAVLMVGLFAGSIFLQQHRTGDIAVTAPSTSEHHAQPLRLASDVDLHARTAEMLLAGEKRRTTLDRARRSLSQTDAIDSIQQQRNRTALLLISQADRQGAQSQRDSAAAEGYRRTIELFPETPAATIAAERLRQIRT